MLHGDPGIGKSAITEKTTQYMIPNSVDDIVSRSEKAIINPESGKHLYASVASHFFLIFLIFILCHNETLLGNGKLEIFDESHAIFDLPTSKLSEKERGQRRVENSALSKGLINYDATTINPENNQRSVQRYKIETDGAKIVNTNVIKRNEGEPMDDRFLHWFVVMLKRKGKSSIFPLHHKSIWC